MLMASTQNSKCRKKKIPSSVSQPIKFSVLADINADDDFQDPSPSVFSSKTSSTQNPLKSFSNLATRPSKKLKNQQKFIDPGKENNFFSPNVSGPPAAVIEDNGKNENFELDLLDGGLDSIESTIDCKGCDGNFSSSDNGEKEKTGLEPVGTGEFLLNSNELRLVKCGSNDIEEEFERGTQLDLLLKLCDGGEDAQSSEMGFNFRGDLETHEEHDRLKEEEEDEDEEGDGLICCPLCGNDISVLSDELRQVHTNECLDKGENPNDVLDPPDVTAHQCPGQVVDGSPGQSARKVVNVSPVLEWLHNLGLAKYEAIFVREEIDWDTLKWLTEEDLCNIGVTALGPRKKLVHALSEIRKECCKAEETHPDVSTVEMDGNNKLATNKLITDYFPGSVAQRKRDCITFKRNETQKIQKNSAPRRLQEKKYVKSVKQKDVPLWCIVPGTPFRVDAFKYLRRDCSHWFLTHFHMDHYQGLTRSFSHGKIFCSSITAKLVHMKLGISWDKLHVLPLNQKIDIEGIDVTCFDANHCPGAVIILFEPPSGKTVLHTGDFRFSEEIARVSTLQTSRIHTLILDTTYCDPLYDFPKQEAVIQFVIEAIQAEEFNPKTLFLIGSYTIGKERLFMEVASVLRKKVYVSAAKLRLLECLGFSKEDMQWFTLNENESHIHIVPMWILASFKRLKHIAYQYRGRFNLIVSFSPTGWTFGKGKKKSPGRRSQQGTIIRYEVPYSEHSSFTELRDFAKFISPASIIPSVNNHGPESANTMISRLLS